MGRNQNERHPLVGRRIIPRSNRFALEKKYHAVAKVRGVELVILHEPYPVSDGNEVYLMVDAVSLDTMYTYSVLFFEEWLIKE